MNLKKKPSPKAAWWISLFLYIAFAVVAALLLILNDMDLAWPMFLICLVVVVFNRTCWVCPHCGKSLGRFARKKNCPVCGEELDM